MAQQKNFLAHTTGILLHPTALPGSAVCGSFGAPSRKWLQKLSKNNIGVWQVLPLTPPDSKGSPYSSPSGFAINPWFLDAKDLVEEEFLPSSIFEALPGGLQEDSPKKLDFKLAESRSDYLRKALREAWSSQKVDRKLAFEEWCAANYWIENHSAFMVIRNQHNNLPWWEWPDSLRQCKQNYLKDWKKENTEDLLEHYLLQWHLDRQWKSVRKLAFELNVVILGDLPFYVSKDSVDVWSNRTLFSIENNGEMEIQSGVPPDYFSETGQLWGTPVYKWQHHKKNNYDWWRRRFSRQWEQFDLLRLDHFRALVSYWAIPGKELTAQKGEWRKSPGSELLQKLKNDHSGKLPLIAEDLGVITKDVEDLRDAFELPGMKILQFAFNGDPKNPYLPENIKGKNWVVYTGTHDNPTTIGWWEKLDIESKERVSKQLKQKIDSPVWQLLELGLGTEASLVIAPLQDLLHLDNKSRFNTPGTTEGNWCWRLSNFDQSIDETLRNYGERGASWGRSNRSIFDLFTDLGNR